VHWLPYFIDIIISLPENLPLVAGIFAPSVLLLNFAYAYKRLSHLLVDAALAKVEAFRPSLVSWMK